MSERRADYLPEHIRDSLIHDPRVAEQDLKVDVKEHRVMLGATSPHMSCAKPSPTWLASCFRATRS